MCFKVTFKSKRIAYKVAGKMKCQAKIPARKNLRAYFCSKCNGWHLTKLTLEEYRNKTKCNDRKAA